MKAEQIRDSLVEQLTIQNKLTDYSRDLVDTYVDYWKMKAGIDGVNYTMFGIGEMLNKTFTSKVNSKLTFAEGGITDEYHYKVMHYEVSDVERVANSIFKFKVVAHTRDGMLYRNELRWISLEDNRPVEVHVSTVSNPIIKLTGNGQFGIGITGPNMAEAVKGMCEGDMVIDTERMIVYRDSDKKAMNTMISGDISSLRLYPDPDYRTVVFRHNGTLTCLFADNERMM